MKKSYVLEAFLETPWAILPSKLVALQEIVTRHVNGEKLSAEEIQARVQGATAPKEQQVSKVAVLPVFGTIIPRATMFSEMSGASSAERLSLRFSELVDDPNVSAIILDINSPGGAVGGIEELSAKIFNARGKKPIVAVVNHLMASAAFWIGTSADEVVISPSGSAGSIGVFSAHADYSVALEKEGIKVSLIHAGKYKVEGNPYDPLSDEARDAIQAHVDEIYDTFVDAVARNRGVESAVVRKDYGQGRMFSARQAVKSGMADRVGTIEETISRLANGNTSPAGSQAKHLINEPQALTQRAENVEAENESATSEQTKAKPDPRDVQRVHNYLKVHVHSKIKE